MSCNSNSLVQLRALPFKLAHSLRQILLIPRDMLRFAGSVRMLIRVLRGALANKAPALTALQLKALDVTDGEDEDNELVPSTDEVDKLARAVLNDELGTVAADAANVAKDADELPEEPPPDAVITIDDEDGAMSAVEDELFDDADDEMDSLKVDETGAGPTPETMHRGLPSEIYPCDGIEVHSSGVEHGTVPTNAGAKDNESLIGRHRGRSHRI